VGDRHLKFHETRDNLAVVAASKQSRRQFRLRSTGTSVHLHPVTRHKINSADAKPALGMAFDRFERAIDT